MAAGSGFEEGCRAADSAVPLVDSIPKTQQPQAPVPYYLSDSSLCRFEEEPTMEPSFCYGN